MWIGGLPGARPDPTQTMSSSQKRFTPHVIAVAQGALVTFPNVDKVFHNVFSRTAGSEFDLGLYRNGASRSVRFNKPGLVRVYCNIHPTWPATCGCWTTRRSPPRTDGRVPAGRIAAWPPDGPGVEREGR